ncbi:hypothetical protein PHYSODRAFT_507596 [Phytophthora sojae]|uniref:Uncharacterized protein n=1 Tax=Phytophthora sojae (strain P6497) TaxID=1094619 RepID=G4ZMS4_PHYSP|nr:hypothetical protein PHYSODRAFT_507596 [Phytophthora sojae]EGZ16044.1 hypothetical protein PHYSODRAFT_507596 [Phytophthora sojae]|eukprot:XP_009529793.1 hypothetical protein PHYSODRAFT_507596 [Phytophthora sojae]
MNRRQAQRSLADLISKCEAAHIQLPEDPLKARAEAVEAIVHSLKDGKANLGDAQEELQQKYGLELVWKQHMENEEAKRQRRRQSQKKKAPTRAKDPRLSKNLGATSTARMGVMTPSKRPNAAQEGDGEMKSAKKAKSARGLIVSGGSSDKEEKPPASGKKAAAGLGTIIGDGNSSGSPDQGIVDMLDLEDLGDPDGGSGSATSSDGEFDL